MNQSRNFTVSAIIICVLQLASGCLLAQKTKVAENYDDILHNVGKMIEIIHYQPKKIDDNFSRTVFKTYFETLDPGKFLFLGSDLQSLKKYETELDEEIRTSPAAFFKIVNGVYRQRITESQQLTEEFLGKPFNFNKDERYIAERDSVDFAASPAEKKELWRKYLAYQVLSQYSDMLEDKKADSLGYKIDTSLERKAREYVLRIQKRNFKKLLDQATEEESFSNFVNSIVHQMDPHSSYFLPVDRRGFQEDLSGIYYGIGALLDETGGKVKINELMIGGPAWRSGQVEKGDVIIAVAEQGQKAQSTEGLSMDETIRLIRGKKGTYVTITFRKMDGSEKKILLARDALQLEDTFVKSAIIQDSVKIGYIYLPKFYTSFGDNNGRSCAFDVARELIKLKRENVKGVIIDIRDNGGGSLGEVIRMVGLFMKEGPVVQVKGRDTDAEADGVNNQNILYDGPLVVLVNELSASASEIFAAAMQDYKRGVIVGSSSTYGKGTVQRPFSVPGKELKPSDADLGTLHLTIQKYYRVNGGATQLKGIIPDVILPGFYQFYHVQEKYNASALPWDEIRKANYKTPGDTSYLNVVRSKSESRQRSVETYATLYKNIDLLTHTGNSYSLDIMKFRQEKKKLQEAIRQVRSSASLKMEMNISNTKEDEIEIAKKEQFRIENNKIWLRNLKKDFYLGEAIFVMKDLLQSVKTNLAVNS
jgi:carboxyl-terminal processing protease